MEHKTNIGKEFIGSIFYPQLQARATYMQLYTVVFQEKPSQILFYKDLQNKIDRPHQQWEDTKFNERLQSTQRQAMELWCERVEQLKVASTKRKKVDLLVVCK